MNLANRGSVWAETVKGEASQALEVVPGANDGAKSEVTEGREGDIEGDGRRWRGDSERKTGEGGEDGADVGEEAVEVVWKELDVDGLDASCMACKVLLIVTHAHRPCRAQPHRRCLGSS